MASINATNNYIPRELIPAGNYVARCYQMLHIGTVPETYMGENKTMNKVRIGWELPTELKIFSKEKGEQPLVISSEFTLSMGDNSNLRKLLASWRGKDFSEDEAKCFDITKLLGVPCMLNIIHKHGKADPSKVYENIGSISPMPKGIVCPPQINDTIILSYDEWNETLFQSLPDFIKDKIKKSSEYQSMKQPQATNITNGQDKTIMEEVDDLPF